MTPVGLDSPPLDPPAVNTLANSLAAAPRLPALHFGFVLTAPAIQHLLQVVENPLFPSDRGTPASAV